MKITITGGSGFVGGHLVDNLLSKGHEVTIFDRTYNKKQWDENNWTDRVNFFMGDLKDREVVFETVRNCDIIVNLGGILGTQELMHNVSEAINVNILGAINVFDAAKLFNKRVFQVQVGNHWMNNPYSISKDATARFASMYRKEFGMDIRVCRIMNVYGERQKSKPIRKIFPNVVIPALLNEEITIYGTGNQVMDLVYVKDTAEILSRVILYDNIPNEIEYEIGTGKITINETVETIVKLTNSKSKITRTDMRPGETVDSVVMISEEGIKNLKKYLDFSLDDFTPREEAFQNTVNWYKDNLNK
jgi:UDP-glucose 4-epimerase